MLTITTRKVDSHYWTIEVGDSHHVNWNAVVDGSHISLYLEKTKHLVAVATAQGEKESDKIGFAIALITNWIEAGESGNEKLLDNWHVRDEQMHIYHLA